MKQTAIQIINRLSVDEFNQRFGNVFEHSPWVAQMVVKDRPFVSVDAMLKAMLAIVQNASEAQKLALIRAHPELGYDRIKLTAESQNEQHQANLNSLTAEQRDTLIQLNKQYYAKFSFPFVISARAYHSYNSIINVLKKRLLSSQEDEIKNSLAQIGQIASFRVYDIAAQLEKEGVLTLSTHVLDLVSGQPAAKIKIVLHYQNQVLFEGVTDNNGRCEIKTGKEILRSGAYQLAFYVADYFKDHQYPVTDPGFLNIIRVDFGMSQEAPSKHYHIPVLLSPYGFSTYKGS